MARLGLRDHAGAQKRLHEAARGAVQAGRFRSVQFDEAIIDAQARQGSEDMLDQRDVGGRFAQRGAALRARHPIAACRDLHGRTQVAAHEAPQGRAFRIGGLVETGSLTREANSLTVRFRVTDTAQTIPVAYTGLLPDLFKEGKGVVAQGTLDPDGTFRASEVLAKHDENYMPPAAADAVKKAHEAMSTKTLLLSLSSGWS